MIALLQALSLNPNALNPVNPNNVNPSDINTVILNVANIVIGIVLAISVFYVVYGGWKWMSDGEKEGKGVVINAVIGLLIAVFAFVIINFTLGLGGLFSRTIGGIECNSQAECSCKSQPNTSWASSGNCSCIQGYVPQGRGILENGCQRRGV